MIEAAQRYASLGWAAIPVGADKRPLRPWAEYQTRRPEAGELADWFGKLGAMVGVVTGKVSNLLVVDADNSEAISRVEALLPDGLELPIATTPRGRHYFFAHRESMKNAVGVMPAVDVRAEGGYVVAPPGPGREWLVAPWDCAPPELPAQLATALCQQVGQNVSTCQQLSATCQHVSASSYGPAALADELARVAAAGTGERNHVLNTAAFRLGQLVGGNILEEQTVTAALMGVALAIGLGRKEAQASIASGLSAGQASPRPPMAGHSSSYKEKNSYSLSADTVADMAETGRFETTPRNDKQKPMMERIREWVLLTPGAFLLTDADKDLELLTRADKNCRSKCFERLVAEGVLERFGEKRGWYRRIERECKTLDWQHADCSQVMPLAWPFFLEQYASIYPKNIIVLAGASNSGKSAFLLNVIRMNMSKHRVVYFSSEMGEEELRLRISKFGLPLSDWTFEARERANNFAHAVEPDAVNIIDFLEVSDNFYQIGGEIRAIFDRLSKGVAIIALQKKGGQALGRGAEFSLEKSRLYLSMDPGKLTIVKGKNWARPGINPNGKTFDFKLVDGCQFISMAAVDREAC